MPTAAAPVDHPLPLLDLPLNVLLGVFTLLTELADAGARRKSCRDECRRPTAAGSRMAPSTPIPPTFPMPLCSRAVQLLPGAAGAGGHGPAPPPVLRRLRPRAV